MKSHTESLSFNSPHEHEYVHITPQVEVIVPVTAGRLGLAPWQRVFYAEFDERRNKRVLIKGIGE
jgi:thiamine phosphate synthase YjbQ (UPF0047 family)